MRVKLRTPWLLVMALLLAGCDTSAWDGPAKFKENFEYTYDLAPGGRISVENMNGSIEVSAGEGDQVHITGTKYASSQALLDALKVDVAATDKFIQVRTVRPSGRRGNMGAKYVIHVPEEVDLDRLINSNGSIEVNGTAGIVRARTSNGSISVDGLQGGVEATTSNGRISIGRVDGYAVLKTSNGAIRVDELHGHLEAATSNGSIKARIASEGEETARPIKVSSSNGSVTLTFDEQPVSEVIAHTSNASITLRLPEDTAATLKATTSNSSVNTEFQVTVEGKTKKSSLRGTINGGGPLLDLSSSNGSIRINKTEQGDS